MNLLEKAFARISTRDNELNRPCALEKSINFIRKINDPIFSEVSIVQNSEDKTYLLLREIAADSKNTMTRFIADSSSRRAISCEYIVKLVDQSTVSQQSFCGSTYTLRQFFEFPKHDLRREIDRRMQSNTPFTSIEMSHLSYQLLIALQHLQEKNCVHGQVSPSAVGMNQEGPIKVKLKFVGDEQTQNIRGNHIRLLQSRAMFYVSPGFYRSLVKKDEHYVMDAVSEEVFALGLTLLEAGTLRSIQNIYLLDGSFDETEFNRLKEEFRSRYNQEAKLMVSMMDNLLQMEDSRPTFKDMLDAMPKYQEVCDFFKNAK